MRRYSKKLTKDITLIYGSDHTLGGFTQITDSRYASSGKDEQGEGYVFDCDELFGTTINLIKLHAPKVKGSIFNVSQKEIIIRCDEFIKSLNPN